MARYLVAAVYDRTLVGQNGSAPLLGRPGCRATSQRRQLRQQLQSQGTDGDAWLAQHGCCVLTVPVLPVPLLERVPTLTDVDSAWLESVKVEDVAVVR